MLVSMKMTRYLAVLLAAVLLLGAVPALAANEYDGLEVADVSASAGYRVAVAGTAITLTVPYSSSAGVGLSTVLSAKAKSAVTLGGEQYTVELTDNGFSKAGSVQIGGYTQVPVAYRLKRAGSSAEAYTGTTTYKVYVGKSSSFTSVSKAVELKAGGSNSALVLAGEFGADKADDDPCTSFELVSGSSPSYLKITGNGAAYTVGSGTKCPSIAFSVDESKLANVEYDKDTAYSVKAYDREGDLIGEGTLIITFSRLRSIPPQ